MATTIKAQMSKFMIALAMAVVASMFCAGSAFASVDVSVTFPTSATTTATKTVTLDQTGVQNSAAAPVVGMFYKADSNGDYQWNVLATGTASNQYASWNSILTNAIAQYNTDTSSSLTIADVNSYATNQKLSLTATDGAYKKYYPNSVDLDGTSTSGAGYFFNNATNDDTELNSSLMTSTYTLISGVLNGTNPNNVGPVFAWKYASAITSDSGTAGDAAQTAAAGVASSTAQAHPRLIMGCANGMDDTVAMGKRYCFNITGITLS